MKVHDESESEKGCYLDYFTCDGFGYFSRYYCLCHLMVTKFTIFICLKNAILVMGEKDEKMDYNYVFGTLWNSDKSPRLF